VSASWSKCCATVSHIAGIDVDNVTGPATARLEHGGRYPIAIVRHIGSSTDAQAVASDLIRREARDAGDALSKAPEERGISPQPQTTRGAGQHIASKQHKSTRLPGPARSEQEAQGSISLISSTRLRGCARSEREAQAVYRQ